MQLLQTRRILILFLLLSIKFIGRAQEINYHHIPYGVQDGLPSSETYDIIQDKNGYIWIATDRGVAKFDGFEFKIYTTTDGLTDNVVFKLFEDYKGRIWFLTYNGQLCYYEDSRIKSYKYNSLVKQSNSSTDKYLLSFDIDQNENVYLGTLKDGLISISKEGLVKTNYTNQLGLHINNANFFYLLSHKGFVHSTSRPLVLNGIKISEINERPKRDCIAMINRDYLLVSHHNILNIIDVNLKKVIKTHTLESEIIALNTDQNHVYIGFKNKGCKKFTFINKELTLKSSIQSDLSVSAIMTDKDSGIWLTTLEDGIKYYPNTDVITLNGFNSNSDIEYVEDISIQNGIIYVGIADVVYAYNISKNIIEDSIFVNNELSDVFFSIKGGYIYNRNKPIIKLSNGAILPLKNRTSTLFVQKLDSSNYINFGRTGYFIISKKDNDWTFSNEISYNLKKIKVESIGYVDANFQWLGTSQGLYSYKNQKTTYLGDLIPQLKSRISSLSITDKQELIVGTRGEGLIMLKDNKIAFQFNKKNSGISEDITSTLVDSKGNIWIGTSQGLHILSGTSFKQIGYYSMHHGLTSNEITSINQLDNQIIVGTKRGISILSVNVQTYINNYPPVLNSIILDGKRYTKSDTIHINKYNRYLDIELLTFDYAANKNIEFKYRIKGLDDKWRYSNSPKIRFESLPLNGTFIIEIYSRRTPNGEWNKTPKVITLITHPPFYSTWTFKISITSLILLLIYLGFKYKVLKYNRFVLSELISRLLKKLGQKKYLVISIDKKTIRIDQDSILFIQAFKDYCEINTNEKKHLYRCTMKSMEGKLPNIKFVRVHRSYIVQIDKIDAISNDELTISNTTIPIGKTYRSSMLKMKESFLKLN